MLTEDLLTLIPILRSKNEPSVLTSSRFLSSSSGGWVSAKCLSNSTSSFKTVKSFFFYGSSFYFLCPFALMIIINKILKKDLTEGFCMTCLNVLF